MVAHVVEPASATDAATAARRPGSAALISTLARVILAITLGVAVAPALWARPLSSLLVAGLLVVVATGATVVPDVRAATVHDRQLDHILAVTAVAFAAWAAYTWRTPSSAVVVALAASAAASLLLVGTRATSRLWPVALAGLTAALPQTWIWLVVVLGLVVALAFRVVRRKPTYALGNRDLGLPPAPRAALEAVVAVAVVALVTYGVIG